MDSSIRYKIPYIFDKKTFALVNVETGEVMEIGLILDFRQGKFLKLGVQESLLLAQKDLSPTSYSIFFYLASKMDYFNRATATIAQMVDELDRSRASVYKALNELYDNGLMVMLTSGEFVLNPIYVSKGNGVHVARLISLFCDKRNKNFKFEILDYDEEETNVVKMA